MEFLIILLVLPVLAWCEAEKKSRRSRLRGRRKPYRGLRKAIHG